MRAWPVILLSLTSGSLACSPSHAGEPPLAAQPVAFSHMVHAGDNQIGCTLCHAFAERGPVAGVPSMARCYGCHKFVGRDKPDIQAVDRAFTEGRPIAWNRVYRVPDHVYFTHERHLAAGLACQTCHGPVQQMEVVRSEAPLTMAWCLQCHEQRHAPTTCQTCHK